MNVTDSPRATSTNAADTSAVVQQLFLPHVTRLLEYFRNRIPHQLRSTLDPQDVVQDTLFAATLSVGTATFNSPADVWSWLVSVGRHVLSRHAEAHATLKRGGHLKHFADDELRHGSVIVLLQDLATHSRTPSRSAVRREFVDRFARSLDNLPPAYRDAVRLRYVDGLPMKEAAQRLNRTEESVRKLAVRGLEALRTELRSLSRYL